jgi:hypothetical protein
LGEAQLSPLMYIIPINVHSGCAECISFVWVNPVLAKCHVRVSKQSCKQANRLILWGRPEHHQKKISIFFILFFKKLEKYD